MARFDGFETRDVPAGGGTVRVRCAGEGDPLLLLHGYPQDGTMWRDAAPMLAEGFRVVVADLPGYGASSRPAPAADHLPHAKRTWAATLVEVMAALGYDAFHLAGHDRGGRVAYRLALDHPAAVRRLAVLDIVPTAEVWDRFDALAGLVYWHWPFLAQPAPLPETLLLGDPDAFWRHGALGLAGLTSAPEAVRDGWRAALRDPEAVTAMCEDYRAGASVDREHDAADREAGRVIAAPLHVLWGTQAALPAFYGEPAGGLAAVGGGARDRPGARVRPLPR